MDLEQTLLNPNLSADIDLSATDDPDYADYTESSSCGVVTRNQTGKGTRKRNVAAESREASVSTSSSSVKKPVVRAKRKYTKATQTGSECCCCEGKSKAGTSKICQAKKPVKRQSKKCCCKSKKQFDFDALSKFYETSSEDESSCCDCCQISDTDSELSETEEMISNVFKKMAASLKKK